METIVKITLWNQDVAALAWDKDKESGVLEFFQEFSTLNLDIAPLIMPLDDIRRGERIFQFAANKGKTFKGLPGLVADSLPDDYGNSVIDEWIAGKGLDQESVTPVDRLCYVGKSTCAFQDQTESGRKKLYGHSQSRDLSRRCQTQSHYSL